MGKSTDIILYQAEWCPYCARIRSKLDDLLLDYRIVSVPRDKNQRTMVEAISGQRSIPVLVDGDVVLDDEASTLAYLDERYGREQ